MNVTRRSLLPEWGCIFLLTVISLWSFRALAVDDRYVIDDFNGLNITTADPNGINVAVVNSNLAISVDCSVNKTRIVSIPLEQKVKDKKIRITITKASGLPYMGKYKTNTSGQMFPKLYEQNFLDYQKGPVFFSLDNKYHKDIFLWFKCRSGTPSTTGVVYIDKIEIVPLEYLDSKYFLYVLSGFLLMMFLIPGFFAYSVFFEGGEKVKLLALLTPLSIFYFLILYLVLILVQKWSSSSLSEILLATYIAFNLSCIAWLSIKKRLGVLASNFRLIRLEMLAIFIVIVCVAIIITTNLDLPLYTFTYGQLRHLTYGAFGAHDPIIQYVNGIAIFHDEPFSNYYKHHRLFYGVQDRGIITGVMYAVMRGIASPLNSNVAYSYSFYTLFGSALNTLVLLPLFALHKYLFSGKQRPLLILFLISASPFLVTNYFLTWYKLAGAGLVISGLVLLLLDKNSIKQWIVAGVLWGLATNFHPSLALALPVLTIWLLCRFWHSRERRILPVACAFFALVGAFVAMNMPWTIVKSTHFEDTNRLFREHFLANQSYDKEHGVVGSIGQFMGRYTLDQQISTRYKRLEKSLRIEEIKSLVKSTSNEKWESVFTKWNLIEAAYSIYVFVPTIILIGISSLLTRLLPATSWNEPLIKHRLDFRWLLITQVLTIFLVIIGSFGKNSPDLTWNLPMSCMVIVLYLLVHRTIAIGKIGAALIVMYSLFVYFRLFFQYF